MVVAAQALWAWQAIKRGDDGSSGGASGPVLVIAFLCGILFHLYRDVIPLSLALFGVVLVVGLGLSALPHGAYYLPVPATYLCVYLGLTKPRPIWLVSSGDYSYGLYLYGYPLQQALASIGPATQHWWVSVGIALPAALLVAVCSWTFVEKPALGLRKRLFVFEERLHWLVLRRPIGLVSVSGELATQRLLRLAVGIAGVAGAILLVNANFEFAVVAVLCAFAGAVVAGRWFGRVDQPG